MKKRSIALVLAAALCFGCAVGGTLAWLTDDTETIVNTFTTSDITIELAETKELDLQMVPGKTITKDPEVTVKANSEDCYVFVEITKSTNYDTYLEEYVVADGWTKLTDGVYYRTVSNSVSDQGFQVLKDDQVKVLTTVTKDQMAAIGENKPTLTFTAYAIQEDYLETNDMTAIWNLAKGN